MNNDEIRLIQSKHNAAIIAPAGHGKTEMITDLVQKLPGKKLVLTHTNAGISALAQRMRKKGISLEEFSLSTISAFCMKWCSAYPRIADIASGINVTDKEFYNDQYRGASRIFRYEWARSVLEKTYSCVIVDEYQDCVEAQHQIFVEINRTLPVYVLGDPLQSIFGWAGKLVSWDNLGFEFVDIVTYPWRWENTNRELGKYLSEVRKRLLPALGGNRIRMPIKPKDDYIKCVSIAEAQQPAFLQELGQYRSVLYLTKWPRTQCSFSQRTGGVFQNDEPQNLSDLYEVAKLLDIDDGHKKVCTIYNFIKGCATHVNSELGSYEKHIQSKLYDFSRIKKYPEFGQILLAIKNNQDYSSMLKALEWIRKNSVFRLFRKELFDELSRAIRFANDHNICIHDAAQQIRMIPNNQSRYSNFKRLSSRTVLSKGLEFECVVINMAEKYTATEMYVAMTRAMKIIYYISDTDYAVLDVPQGFEK